MLRMDYQDLPVGKIIRRLALAQETPIEEAYLSAFLSDAPRPAAVLVPLLRASIPSNTAEQWHILLTRRSDRLTEHRGQVAFPGGRSDPEDISPQATALREAYEEIGLPPEHVTTLGTLNPMLTITNYSVTPVVGIIPWPHALRPSSDEVSRIFTIPLAWLAEPTHREVRQHTLPAGHARILHAERTPVIYFQPYDHEILWGISAEITVTLLHALFGE